MSMDATSGRLAWGALFDWDGVVIDSSRHHEESWDRLSAETGLVLPEGHFKKGFGMKNDIIIPELLGWTREIEEIKSLSLRKEELYREVVVEWGLEPLPGVREFLTRLRDAGIPAVIGSSTHRRNIDTALGMLGLGGFFKDITSAEDVTHGKPAPDVFLAAARKAGVPAERCVVFEDALVGIEAAHRAGCRAVAVTTTNARELLLHADRVVDQLDEIQPSELAAWFDDASEPAGQPA